jgi:hypothetical protein
MKFNEIYFHYFFNYHLISKNLYYILLFQIKDKNHVYINIEL